MRDQVTSKSGFSLVEISIAASLIVIVISLTMVGLLYTMSSSNEADVQSELDVDVQASMERIKQDLRLTSLDKCVFYPAGAGPYTAISFPAAQVGTNGAIALATNGMILWDKRIVYHVWTSAPSQLRKTTFNPQPALTDAQLQEQINSVVTNGNGNATYGAGSAATEVVFQNLFTWSLSPRKAQYDGYAAALTREVAVNLGFALITGGVNRLKFTVVGTNRLATGRGVGVDSIAMSPSYGAREAEAQITNATWSGATPVARYQAGGWDGNYELYFPATATGQYFTLNMENDRWEETDFTGVGSLCQDTEVAFDQTLSPMDYVVRMPGNSYAWYANEQTGDAAGSAPPVIDSLNGCAVRVLVKGSDMLGGEWIKFSGSKCYLWFEAVDSTSRKLKVEAAYIAECADGNNPSPDIVAGTSRQVFFSGSGNKLFPDGVGYNWSDRIDFPIDRRKSYLVSFLVGTAASQGNAWRWQDTGATNVQSYILTSALAADLTAASWIGRTNLVSTNSLFGLRHVWARYPTNAFFTSPIYDTHLAAPAYSSLGWNATVPFGASLLMRVRASSNAYMQGAAGWTNITAQTTAGVLNPYPGSLRYVQFQAELRSDSGGTVAPTLKDVTICWPGLSQTVDIIATMSKAPNFGISELTVNGVELKQGINVDLTIFKDLRSFGASKRLTSSLNDEVRPRNTGR